MPKKKRRNPDKAPKSWILPSPSPDNGDIPDVAKHLLSLYKKLYEQDTGLPAYGNAWNRYIDDATRMYKNYVERLVETSPDLVDRTEFSKMDAIDASGLTDSIWPGGLLAEHLPYAETLSQPVYAFAPCFQKGIMLLPDVPGTIRNYVQFEVMDLDGEAGTMTLHIRDYCKAPGRFEPGIGCEADIQAFRDAYGQVSTRIRIYDRLGFPDLYTRIRPTDLGWTRQEARQWRKTVLQNAVDQADRFQRNEVDPCLQLVQRFLSGCLAANAGLSATKPVIEKPAKADAGKTDGTGKPGKEPARDKPSDKAPPERRVRIAGLVKFSSARPPRPANKAAREYRTPSWTARGHIRHYKNGTQVYIRPMVKHRKALAGKDGHVPSTVKILDNRPAELKQEDTNARIEE